MAKRFSKTDWLELGLELLAQKGAPAMRIELLCKKAKRSKGSFYHHFKDREGFIKKLISFWQEKLTERIIAQAEQYKTPTERLIALNKLTHDIVHGKHAKTERALRHWAANEPIISKSLAETDKRRTDYVASLLVNAGINSRTAIDLAVMNYAMLIGMQQMPKPPNVERRKRIDEIYVGLLQKLANK